MSQMDSVLMHEPQKEGGHNTTAPQGGEEKPTNSGKWERNGIPEGDKKRKREVDPCMK